MGKWDDYFSKGLVSGFLTGDDEHVGSAIRIIAVGDFKGAGGAFGFVEELPPAASALGARRGWIRDRRVPTSW